MATPASPPQSHWAMVADLVSAKVLVWAASVGRNVDLKPEAHIYFFDRYSRLAQYHRDHGRVDKARRLQMKADEHYRAGGGLDGPPYAAAMGMPRPRRFVRTDAVSRDTSGGDDAA